MTKLKTWVCLCGLRWETSAEWQKCYSSHKETVMHNGVRHVKVVRKRTV